MSIRLDNRFPKRIHPGFDFSLKLFDLPIFSIYIYRTIAGLNILGFGVVVKSKKARVMVWW